MNAQTFAPPPLYAPERLALRPLDSPEQLKPRDQIARNRWRHFAREAIETLALTLIVFFLIRLVVQNFRIEGASMEPNLHDGQFLIINKFVYQSVKPQRGDVVVFRYPPDPARDFIKRVIALPGDRVVVAHGRVMVNGAWLDEPYPLNPGSYSFEQAIVGADELFVLGDNRNYSSDSHTWGMLPFENVIGKAWLSYWPPDFFGWVQEYSYAAAP
ncbi:MAG: signal peptidase I [Chloroflexi bacterium]|nr:signal peptidase I [Chloroflexota bacterium]